VTIGSGVSSYDAGLSYQHLLQWSVPMVRPCPPVVTVVRRPWHLLDTDAEDGFVDVTALSA